MAYDSDSEYAKSIGHEFFETAEGIYCTRCVCYYRDMDEYLNYHRLRCRGDSHGARLHIFD